MERVGVRDMPESKLLKNKKIRLERVGVNTQITPNQTKINSNQSKKYSRVQNIVHSTIQYSVVQFNTVQSSTVWYSTVQNIVHSTVQSTVQYSTVQIIVHSRVQYSIQYSR